MVINKLTLLSKDFPAFVVRKNSPNALGRCEDFKINKEKVLVWLLWLKYHSRHHVDVIMNTNILDQLLEGGSMFDQLMNYDENDEDNDDTSSDIGGNEIGTE